MILFLLQNRVWSLLIVPSMLIEKLKDIFIFQTKPSAQPKKKKEPELCSIASGLLKSKVDAFRCKS